jgi:hypothetical protein
VILENALDKETIEKLRKDLYGMNTYSKSIKKEKDRKKDEKGRRHDVFKCFFENSSTTVDIIENSKLTDFA